MPPAEPAAVALARRAWPDLVIEWCPIEVTGRAGEREAGERAARAIASAIGVPLPAGRLTRSSGGRPRWPTGVAASIAHAGGVALAAGSPSLAAIGVDIERAAALSLYDAAYVLRETELAAARASADPAGTATLLWSAKEAAFKAQCHLRDDDLDGTDPLDWSVTLRTGEIAVDHPYGSSPGRWVCSDGYVITVVTHAR